MNILEHIKPGPAILTFDWDWENPTYLHIKFDLMWRFYNAITLSVIHTISKMSSYMQTSMRNSIKLTDFG